MALPFAAGDNLVFQMESGFGLLRIIAVDSDAATGGETVWHLLAYDEFFIDVEAAEAALASGQPISNARATHLALTDQAFEKTAAAQLSNNPVTDTELASHQQWMKAGGTVVADRSVTMLLGLR